MEDSVLPVWVYTAVLSLLLLGAMQRVLLSQPGAMPGAVPDAVPGAVPGTVPGAIPGAVPGTVQAGVQAGAVLMEQLWEFRLPALLLAAAAICLWLARRTPPALQVQGKAVLITGCDSGFGLAAAIRLDALGFQVVATVLDLLGDGARQLRSSCSPRLHLLQLDITQPGQVQQALLDTRALLGPRGLWGLVNNAGVCVNFGDAELSLMSNFRGCMEVNFFGTLSVTQSFLPLLRRGPGRIVCISSPAGDQPFPCLAAYGASKAALNLLTDTLRHELQPWGVSVSTILPASYKTGRTADQAYWERQHQHLLQNLPPALLEDYGQDYLSETRDLFLSFSQQADPDLSPVVDTIVQALLAPRPAARYFAGPGVGFMYLLHTYCPPSISSLLLQRLFLKKRLRPRALRQQDPDPGLDRGLDRGLDLHNNNNNNNEVKFQQL